MKIEEIINSDAFIRFYETLLSMRVRGSDRDNTVLLALRFDNFEDFYEHYKYYFIVSYKDEKNLFKAIFRVFFSAQFSCISPEQNDREAMDRFQSFIYESVETNIDGMIAQLKKNHPKIYDDIKNNNLTKEIS